MLEGPDGGRAPVWPYSQALAAAVDMAVLTGDRAEVGRVGSADSHPTPEGTATRRCPGSGAATTTTTHGSGSRLTQFHLQTGDAGMLEHARRVFGFVAEGQDPDGGVRWLEGRRSRNTCSTAPAAAQALRLDLIERDADAEAFADRALRWLHRELRLASGLFGDHVDRFGRIDRTIWSYNQGSVAGAFTAGLPPIERRPRPRGRDAHGARFIAAFRRGTDLATSTGVQRRVVPQPPGARRDLARARPAGRVRSLPRPRLAHRARSRHRPVHRWWYRVLRRHPGHRPGRSWCSCSRFGRGLPIGYGTCADGPSG